jgi:hypothetical protein
VVFGVASAAFVLAVRAHARARDNTRRIDDNSQRLDDLERGR